MSKYSIIFRSATMAAISVTVFLLSVSCIKETAPVEPVAEEPVIEFSVAESRLSGSNEFGVVVTLGCDRRDEWWGLSLDVDGKTRKDLARAGHLFEESKDLTVPLGPFNNGRHTIDVTLTDRRDSSVVRHVYFNCIGNYEGESKYFYGIHFTLSEYEVGLGKEETITLKTGVDVNPEDIAWSISGNCAGIVKMDGASVTLSGLETGTATLTALVKGTETVATTNILVIEKIEDINFSFSPETAEIFEGQVREVTVAGDCDIHRVYTVRFTTADGTHNLPLHYANDAAAVAAGDNTVKVVSYTPSSVTFSISGMRQGTDITAIEIMRDGYSYGQRCMLTTVVNAEPSYRFIVTDGLVSTDPLGEGTDGFAVPMGWDGRTLILENTTGSIEGVDIDFSAASSILDVEKAGDRWKLLPKKKGVATFTVKHPLMKEGKTFNVYVFDVLMVNIVYDYTRSLDESRMINSAQMGVKVRPGEGVDGIRADITLKANYIPRTEDVTFDKIQGSSHTMEGITFAEGEAHYTGIGSDIWNVKYSVEDRGYSFSDLTQVEVNVRLSSSCDDDLVFISAAGSEPPADFAFYTFSSSSCRTLKKEILDFYPYLSGE